VIDRTTFTATGVAAALFAFACVATARAASEGIASRTVAPAIALPAIGAVAAAAEASAAKADAEDVDAGALAAGAAAAPVKLPINEAQPMLASAAASAPVSPSVFDVLVETSGASVLAVEASRLSKADSTPDPKLWSVEMDRQDATAGVASPADCAKGCAAGSAELLATVGAPAG
jgi:tellurite resistance protein TehA-like permease